MTAGHVDMLVLVLLGQVELPANRDRDPHIPMQVADLILEAERARARAGVDHPPGRTVFRSAACRWEGTGGSRGVQVLARA